jgi:hypothetical protein
MSSQPVHDFAKASLVAIAPVPGNSTGDNFQMESEQMA